MNPRTFVKNPFGEEVDDDLKVHFEDGDDRAQADGDENSVEEDDGSSK